MKFVWNDEMQEALGAMCLLAHKQRVDITITFTHDGDVEVKAEPTYWDRDTADTPQTEETCERCVYVRGSQWCQGCNGTPKRWDGEKIVDTPQTDCETCKHYKLACELFSEICKYEPTTQTETQNSNLTFEKVMEEIQTQVIEFPDTHQKFTFARKIEMDGDSIKIGGWKYKGVKDAERFVKGSEQTERSE